uniref:Uncharacterized protein n=1 Tax=Steinernema glaseri TaxID=37863 RepID=A0A1I7YL43_9BILA
MESKVKTNDAIIMVPRPLQSTENLEMHASRKNSISSNLATRFAGSIRSAFGSSLQLDKRVPSLSRIPEIAVEESCDKPANGSLQKARKRRSSVNVAEISAQQLKDQTKPPTLILPYISRRRYSDPEKSQKASATGGPLAAVDEIDERSSSTSQESIKEPSTVPFCVSSADCYASMSLSPESSDEDDDKEDKADENLFKDHHTGKKFY